jgi:hypothetical protein
MIKTGSHHGLLAVVAVAALFTSACSVCPFGELLGLDERPGASRHFESADFGFEYPADWQTLSEIWGRESDVGVADPGSATPWEKYLTSVRIEKRALPPDSSLEALFQETDPQAERVISEGAITLAGATAYERVYEKFHGEPLRKIREVWLEERGTVYVISCWSTPGRYDESLADFDLIIGSFQVK